ncbi:hypothetical protein [Desulfosporosinus meridiei]|uniref:Uncharacterized protein n=1 Tax=Desulfosporosinus meridiei (strain ATCC BAA-275 / DSM 13257 / KCTC 12902 / NCIMB 13706 / S10) TaxID=768704 RepID=J7IWA7_DESMD|nr:hypothetical protein [Desulfosporosinus meridiei]AFQ46025.1 hypothetical protein Desmer_4197 [Desulfosporosinus meridiei DSM 13257]
MVLPKISKTLIFIIIGIFLSISFFFLGTPWGYLEYKIKFQEYLKDKYKKEFIIKKISYTFIHGGLYDAEAYEINQPDISFYVGQDYRTKAIEDGYYYTMWHYQANADLAPIIESLYPDSKYSIEVFSNADRSIFEGSEMPNYKKVTTLILGISLANVEFTDENALNEVEKVKYLLTTLKDQNLKLSDFGLHYKNKAMILHSQDIDLIHNVNNPTNYLVDYR